MQIRSANSVTVVQVLIVLLAGCAGDDSSPKDTAKMPVGSAGSGATDAGVNADLDVVEICTKFCALVEPLECPNDTSPCSLVCWATYQSPQCGDELRALIDCSITRKASDFECDSVGESDVKAGVCTESKTALSTCASMVSGLTT